LDFFHIFKGANIQIDRSGSEFVDLFNGFGVVNYPSNADRTYWLVDLC